MVFGPYNTSRNNSPKGKAPGPDGIPNAMLNPLPKNFHQYNVHILPTNATTKN